MRTIQHGAEHFTVGSNGTGNGTAATNLHNAEFCPPYSNDFFEAMDSSVPYIVNAVLNVLLAITTTLANLLVLLVLRHITSIRLPSKLLLYSLLLSDFGTGLVIQPQFAVLLLMKTSKHPRSVIVSCFLTRSNDFLGFFFGGVSLLTMTAISLDRYLALFYHLRYQQIVTTRRVSAVLIFIWLFSVFVGSTYLWAWVVRGYTLAIGFGTCFLVMSAAYIKIYLGLRRRSGPVQHETHGQVQQAAGNTLNIARYKKMASAMLWVYVLFILCFIVPFVYGTLKNVIFKHTALTQCIMEIFYTVTFLNSCLNPFVYCVRLPDIRTEVLKTLRKLCCLCSHQ